MDRKKQGKLSLFFSCFLGYDKSKVKSRKKTRKNMVKQGKFSLFFSCFLGYDKSKVKSRARKPCKFFLC
jgi:hypothetical protein